MKRFAAPLIAVNKTNKQSRVSDAGVKLIEDLEILRDKTRFEDEVLRRVSGNSQLRRQDQLRAGASETLVSADDLLKIATQIPDGRVNLSKTDLHAALEQIMRNPASSNPLLLRSMIRSNQTREILERKLTNLLWLLLKIAAREIFLLLLSQA